MVKKALSVYLILAVIFCVAVYYFYNQKLSEPLTSPLVGPTEASVNQWVPKVLAVSTTAGPQITGKSAFFIEANSGDVLYAKDHEEKLPIASLTKVMTALIAVERKTSDAKYLVSREASEMEPDKMFLIAGESLSLKELLYGLFLLSANDAAEVIAQGTTTSREDFLNLMNEKAKELGMKNTKFVNPTGLDEDSGSSYSTAYDLAILTRYFIKNYPWITEISAAPYVEIQATQTHRDYQLYNAINLITTYPGVVGFKIGYTPEAGFTIITLAKKGNRQIIGVLLNSDNRRDETKQLLDYSFRKMGIY
jgi:serine-type D-Ala-D-Ala carboxypeptidase (penicillin-binding protein 5/6)